MPKLTDIFVSIVLAVDNHAVDVPAKVKTIAGILRLRYANYEVLIIDNGIKESEYKNLIRLLSKVPCLRIVSLSRSHDADTAIFAGIEASIGDHICTLYNNDPPELIPKFVERSQTYDIVFGVATNLQRSGRLEDLGARIFYWYSKRYLDLDIPNGSTYFICMNRVTANALTRSGRYMRHIRHMSKRVGFKAINYKYKLPKDSVQYAKVRSGTLVSRAIDLVSNYSNHPLRLISYFGIFAGLANIIYAIYVVLINISRQDIQKGWTTLSLQASLMFFILFMILAVLAEYIGKILNETQHEPPYHIMSEQSSTISIADETRLNVSK